MYSFKYIVFLFTLAVIIAVSIYSCIGEDEVEPRRPPLGAGHDWTQEITTFNVKGQLTNECGVNIEFSDSLSFFIPIGSSQTEYDTFTTVTTELGEFEIVYQALYNSMIPFHGYPPYLVRVGQDSITHIYFSRVRDQTIEMRQGDILNLSVNISFNSDTLQPIEEINLQFWPYNPPFLKDQDLVIQGPISNDTTISFSPMKTDHHTISNTGIYNGALIGRFRRCNGTGGTIQGWANNAPCLGENISVDVTIYD